MDYTLGELLDTDRLQELIESLGHAQGLSIAITDTQGSIILSAGRQNICEQFHRKHDKTLALCRESDGALAASMRGGSPVGFSTCKNGLNDAAAPVSIAGETVGYLVIGQFLLQPPDESFFRQQARRCGFDEEAYITALGSVPIIKKEYIELHLRFLARLAGIIADLGYNRLQQLEAAEIMKAGEQELRQLATAVEQADEIILITDLDGTVNYANPAFAAITGWDGKDSIGKNIAVLRDGRSSGFEENILDTMKAGTSWKGSLICMKKDGRRFEAKTAVSPAKSGGDITHYVIVMRDVTHEAAIEQQLRQSQKMEALGTLAGGIAHDFNNILAAIIGYADMALDDVDEDGSAGQYLQQIRKSGKRAKELVRQILSFTRKSDHEKKPVKLKLLVQEAMTMLRAMFPSTIKIRQKLKSRAYLLADTTQMQQLIMNLCTNAAHAMRESGGTLEVALQDIRLDSTVTISRQNIKAGEYVTLSVGDTGCGIDSEIEDRIFEPFFTTKELGEGTGMGLALVHGIVENHNGHITVDSKPGHGSKFTVYLPRQLEQADDTTTSGSAPPKGAETVLFVDDEEDVTDVAEIILKSLGYSVVATTSSLHGLELFKQDLSRFDLVITDQTMPDLTGYELSKSILQLRPGIPIILCTGFSDNVSTEKIREIGIRTYLMKPLNRQELAEAVRSAIDSEDE